MINKYSSLWSLLLELGDHRLATRRCNFLQLCHRCRIDFDGVLQAWRYEHRLCSCSCFCRSAFDSREPSARCLSRIGRTRVLPRLGQAPPACAWTLSPNRPWRAGGLCSRRPAESSSERKFWRTCNLKINQAYM